MIALRMESWPLWVGFLVLIAGAIMDLKTGKIYNKYTYPAALLALILATAKSIGLPVPIWGGLESCLGTAAIASGLVFLSYILAVAGGGTVKLQMAFGAWLGCAVDLRYGWRLAVASFVAISITWLFILGAAYLIRRKIQGETSRAVSVSGGLILCIGNAIGIAVSDAMGWV
jgi:prepilin signal peptidase PulO-like enzyme (type II secretory pathway)